MKNMLLETGRKVNIDINWPRIWLNCILVFRGRKNLEMMKLNIQWMRFLIKVLKVWPGFSLRCAVKCKRTQMKKSLSKKQGELGRSGKILDLRVLQKKRKHVQERVWLDNHSTVRLPLELISQVGKSQEQSWDYTNRDAANLDQREPRWDKIKEGFCT